MPIQLETRRSSKSDTLVVANSLNKLIAFLVKLSTYPSANEAFCPK